jgi:hypothetical protein
MKPKPNQITLVITLTAIIGLNAQAQFFTPGNLAVLRVGDGTQILANTGNTVFIDQYTTSGSFVNTTNLPDSGTNALIIGSATSDGGLTRSMDRSELVIFGYNTNRVGGATSSIANASAASVPRAIVTVDASGEYELVQTPTNFYSGNNARCAVSDGTNHFWLSGANSGTVYFNPPSAGAAVQTGVANTRYIKIVNGNLFFSTQSGTLGIYTLTKTSGTNDPAGLRTTSAGVTTNLLFATGSSSQPVAFEINPSLTVVYVADNRAKVGGIQKWTNNVPGSTNWGLAYTLGAGTATTGSATNTGTFGVAVDFSGANAIIYATTAEAASNRLVCIVDTNSSATATMLAAAANNCSFRGLDFVPELATIVPASLTIQQSGTNAIISWPVAAAGYTLQGNTDLSQASGWSTAGTPTVSNGSNTVTVPITNSAQFFRLKQ